MKLRPVLRRLTAVVLCLVLMTALAGCFAPGRVTLAALDTPEALLAGEIMAQQLEGFGLEVVRGQTYSSLYELEAGMRDGEFDIAAIFLQDALTGFSVINEDPIFDNTLADEIVNNTIRDLFGYMLLELWSVSAGYSLLIYESLAEGAGIDFFALSAHAPTLTLAAAPSFLDSNGGFAHMLDLFGDLQFGEVVTVGFDDFYDARRLREEMGADIVAVRATSNGEWFRDAGFVPMGGGLVLWPTNPLAPIVSEDTIDRLPEVRAVLSPLQFQIDVMAFNRSLRDISHGLRSIEEAAEELIQSR